MTSRAKARAREILQQYGYRPPIDVYQVAKDLELEVVEEAMEDYVSGMLVRRGKRGIIAVNSKHHPNRRRFSVAHEIAHFVLDHEGNKFVDAAPVFFRDDVSGKGISSQEIEANNFAAELLMPFDVITERLRRRPIDAFDDLAIQNLANYFEVSVQALTIRLVKLGLITSWEN